MCAKKKSPSDPDENFLEKKQKKMERELIFHCCFVFFV
jgi:hypothetical protein